MSTPLHREPDANRSWVKSHWRLQLCDCIIKALKNGSMVRGGPGGQREVTVLISGRRDADVKFTFLRNSGKR